MRRKRVLRGLCSARLSGNSYLLVGAIFAVAAPFLPVIGPALTPIFAVASTFLAAGLIATMVGALLAPAVL